MGSQHPSPNVKTLCNFEPQIWPEIITSRDAKSACFKGSRTSCDVIDFGFFWQNFGRKRSHHVMDASCRGYSPAWQLELEFAPTLLGCSEALLCFVLYKVEWHKETWPPGC